MANKYRDNHEVKGHLSTIFTGRFSSVAIRQWPLTPVSAQRIYSVIIELLFVFVGAVFVAPRSEELGIAKQ